MTSNRQTVASATAELDAARTSEAEAVRAVADRRAVYTRAVDVYADAHERYRRSGTVTDQRLQIEAQRSLDLAHKELASAQSACVEAMYRSTAAASGLLHAKSRERRSRTAELIADGLADVSTDVLRTLLAVPRADLERALEAALAARGKAAV